MSDTEIDKIGINQQVVELKQQLATFRDVLKEKERAFAQTEKRAEYLQAVLDSLPYGISVTDTEGFCRFSNAQFEKMIGLSREELTGFQLGQMYPPEEMMRAVEQVQRLAKLPLGESLKIHFVGDTKYGRKLNLKAIGVNRLDEPIKGFVGLVRPVDLQEEIETEFPMVDKQLRAVFNSVQDAIIVHDYSGRIRYINEKAIDIFKLVRARVPLEAIKDAGLNYGPQDKSNELSQIWKHVLAGAEQRHEWKIRRPSDGTLFDAEVFIRKIELDGKELILASIRDITERKQIEKQLKASLNEKEILLKEIHHRVKNNLNIIVSLLRIQARRMMDQKAQELFKEAEFRVRCIGMVHEKLYQSHSLADLNLNDFLASLIRHLLNVYETKGKRIDVQTNIDEVFLPIEAALPVGFITSELFSNSLKHAFPGDSEGEIRIYLHATKDGSHELTIQDNGIGIPAEYTLNNLKSLGLDLVKSFAQKLNGELFLTKDSGTTAKVRFKL